MKKYKLAAMGGTFDRLHKGHKTLISYGFKLANEVYIGITNEGMGRKGKDFYYCIQNYKQRKKEVESFAKSIGKKGKLRIVKLDDIFGPTLTDKKIDVLVCSPLTISGAKFINKAREKKKLRKLPIEICKLEKCSDGVHISSTRIRKGEIDRNGFVYESLFEKEIVISKKVRQKLKEPFGILVNNNEINLNKIMPYLDKNGLKIAVGDVASWTFLKLNIWADLFIFDNKTKRKEKVEKLDFLLKKENLMKVKNQAGKINYKVFSSIKQCILERKHLKIIGEEDLAVIPAVLYSPLQSTVIYGQPDEGLVIVKVNEKQKAKCKNLILSCS